MHKQLKLSCWFRWFSSLHCQTVEWPILPILTTVFQHFFKKNFIGVELIYNVVLISAAQQNESVILINTKHSLLTQTSKRLAIHFIIITIIVLRELKRERTKKTRQKLFGKRSQKFRDEGFGHIVWESEPIPCSSADVSTQLKEKVNWDEVIGKLANGSSKDSDNSSSWNNIWGLCGERWKEWGEEQRKQPKWLMDLFKA